MGSARAIRVTVLQVTAGPEEVCCTSACRARRGRLHKRVVFQSTGLRDLEGALSLAVSQRGQSEQRSMGGERIRLGTLPCSPGKPSKDGREGCMIAPVREGMQSSHWRSCTLHSPLHKKRGHHTESVPHTQAQCARHGADSSSHEHSAEQAERRIAKHSERHVCSLDPHVCTAATWVNFW